ncbi:MAG: hypothetical protein LIO94_06675 [Clostridiales bacterium]|nr:hypothetical protein [Clostridiales bacterium]
MDSEEQKLHPWHVLGLTEPDTEEDEEAISRRMAEELKKALEEVSAPYQATEVLPEQWSLEEKKTSVQENPTVPKKQADSENSSEPKKSAVEKPDEKAEPEKNASSGKQA